MMQKYLSKQRLISFFGLIFIILLLSLNIPPINGATEFDLKVLNLLQQMTLEEKIGQMTQADRTSIADVNDIQKYGLGALLSGGDSNPPNTTPEQMADWVDQCQFAALQSRLKIPILYGIDAVHGYGNIINSVIFPHNIGMGATGDPQLAEKAARITAIEMVGTGVRWAFAPCIAVAGDERWGRNYESYGETSDWPILLGVAAIKGFQGDLNSRYSVLACAKHYIGDGGTQFGTGIYGGNDQGDTRVSEEILRQLYLPPYIAAVKAGVRTVMASYSSWNGQKLHNHQYLLTKVLKEELGFTGFIVSDFRGIDQLPGSYNNRVATAINAGIDMVMGPVSYEQFINTVKTLVEKGQIPTSRINDAVARILRVKFELGLFEAPYADRNLLPTIGSQEHREVARQCVRESLVLLKNDGQILPLSTQIKRIIVAGRCADNLGYQCGGWTIKWQGDSGNITTGTTILQGIRQTVSAGTTVSYSRDGKVEGKADVAVVVVGETPYAEFQGDITNPDKLTLSSQDQETINNIKKTKIPMIIVLISGRSLVITDELKKSKAFIAAWLPGTEGQGVADVLFGSYNPTGKLPCSWPKTPEQIPVNTGDPNYAPLFEYGFGLSY